MVKDVDPDMLFGSLHIQELLSHFQDLSKDLANVEIAWK